MKYLLIDVQNCDDICHFREVISFRTSMNLCSCHDLHIYSIPLHPGGFSQRLPIASALGKIFAAVPLGDPLYQMLEIKLALFVDFPSRMKPGVLVAAADCLELYCVTEDDGALFDRPGFTALAHPSSLITGTTHGVFVLDPSKRSADLDMEKVGCLRFLHKPRIAEMRANGAVHSNCLSLPDTEFVYTDSTFYFDFQTSRSLLNLLKELEPLTCEIDAYGDFLQALGPNATIDYTSNTANVTKEESSLVETRNRIFHRLKGTPLNVLVLNNSKFYHLGTTSEYLLYFTEDVVLRSELGLLSSAFSLPAKQNPDEDSGGVVMHSVLHPSCTVGTRSVVEYSRLEAGVCIGQGSIISSCWVSEGLSVPDGILVHSLCVNYERRPRFLTVIFGIDDDLKRRSEAPREELKLFGRSLAECLSHWELGDETVRFSRDEPKGSLWEARLFPVCPDYQSSFSMSLAMLRCVLSGSTFRLPSNTTLMSIDEALQSKNLEEMLKFRKGLYDEIRLSKST